MTSLTLTRTEMLDLIGVSRTLWADLAAMPDFPKAIMIGKRAKWRRDEVVAWVASR